MSSKVSILSKVHLFIGLTTEDLSALAEDFVWESYSKGSYIINQGQEEHKFYIITKGKAEAYVKKEHDHSLQVNIFNPGDTFGEIALFTGKPATVSVRCLEDCEVLVLDSEHFAHMLVTWPKLYEHFVGNFSKRLSQTNLALWEARYKDLLYSGFRINQLKYKFYDIWGSVKTTKEVEGELDRLAKSQSHVLLIGERGTGQQMMAWHLHKKQFGEEAPFLVIDGRQLDQQWGNLILNNLLSIADGGSIFIRDVNLIAPSVQHKLTDILETKGVNCRLIGSLLAKTEALSIPLNLNLADFFTESYTFSPLRERKRDIPILAQGIFQKLATKHGRNTPILDQEATKLLLTHHYRQGNVTELIQIVERAFFLADGDVIRIEHLFFGPTAQRIGRNINLLAWENISKAVKKGIFPFWVEKFTVVVFIFLTLALLFEPDSLVGEHGMWVAWALWWPSMVLTAAIFGRIWCAVCPFSFIMQLAQKVIHLDKPVPDFLKKYDYIFITFGFAFIFWVEIVSGMRLEPLFTGLWLIVIFLAATITGIIYTRHTWCRHLCPLGGFIGMGSITGILEVRANSEICVNKCTTHECFRGKGENEGCPMFQHAAFLDSNSSCKMCMRCIRNCPNGAINFNLRVPLREVWHLVRVNQGFSIFVGVALAILVPIIYFEPFHGVWPTKEWNLWFGIFYWGTAILAALLTWFLAKPFSTKAASRRIKLVFSLIPTVIGGYIAYQLHFAPGAKTVLLGVGYKASDAAAETIYIPALWVGQTLAFFLGLMLTTITVVMVFLRTNKST